MPNVELTESEDFGTDEHEGLTGPKAVGVEDSADAPEPLHELAGDWADDDGAALDAFFEANPEGPRPPEFDLALQGHFSDLPKPTSRLITRALTIGQPVGTDRAITPADPVQVFPANPNRKYLRLRLGFRPDVMWSATAPAPGANWLQAPLTFPMEQLVAFVGRLTTDANVATRLPAFRIGVSPGVSALTSKQQFPHSGQAASLLNDFYWESLGAVNGTSVVVSLIPAQLSAAVADVLQLNVSSIQVGDQVSQIRVTENTHLWRVAGEKSDVYGAADLTGAAVWESDCHTGPVWVYAPNSVGTCDLVAESVSC